MTVKADGGNGVIVANGGRFGGYSLWVNQGVPTFSYNLVMIDMYRWKGAEKLSAGNHNLKFGFVYDGGGFGNGGVGTLSVGHRSNSYLIFVASETFSSHFALYMCVGHFSLDVVKSGSSWVSNVVA